MTRLFTFLILSVFLAVTCGCGYTTSSLLPPELDSIHVGNFTNRIDPTQEVSDKNATFFYFPGMETDITRQVIDGFIFDRHLDVKREADATLLLKGQLIELDRYPLSYSKTRDVEEFRVEVIVNIELYDNRTGKLMWKEPKFMGQFDYDVVGPNAKTEAAAVTGAIKDLSKRIVERTVEAW
ncbi:MAG: LPS assembly lipoprotein LptE [Candidatus Omnitrophota bacterium]